MRRILIPNFSCELPSYVAVAARVVGLPRGADRPIRIAARGPLGGDDAVSNAMTVGITTQCIQVTGESPIIVVFSWRLAPAQCKRLIADGPN